MRKCNEKESTRANQAKHEELSEEMLKDASASITDHNAKNT